MRRCGKSRCEREATVTMALRYDPREVLLVELLPEPDRNLVDLCDEHAVSLRPPMGWTVIDERSPKPAAAAFGWLASPAP